MPSFGGVNIFGIVTSMPTVDNRRDRQLNAYNGLNGLEILDGGSRGRVTRVTGVLYGNGLSGLTAAEDLFRSYQDGAAYPVNDTTGKTWPYPARLERFVPADSIKRDADGTCFRAYSAEFLHLG